MIIVAKYLTSKCWPNRIPKNPRESLERLRSSFPDFEMGCFELRDVSETGKCNPWRFSDGISTDPKLFNVGRAFKNRINGDTSN